MGAGTGVTGAESRARIVLARVVGWLTLLVCASLVVIAAVGLRGVERTAAWLAVVAGAFGETLEPGDWAGHWRLTMAVILVLSAAGTGAGYGLLRLRRWGAALLSAVAGLALLFQVGVMASGYARYAFEGAEPAGLGFLAAVSAGAALAWWRWPAERA